MTDDRTRFMTLARALLAEAARLGYDPAKAPHDQPPGVYDLWASADKALCNAHLGLLKDACAYLNAAQDSLDKAQRLQQPEPAPVGSAVWLLTVHQRHGDDSTVHASREGAQAALAAYVDQCLMGQDYPDEDAVAAYFEATGGGEEWYEISALTVQP